jgi:hypothetical protein
MYGHTAEDIDKMWKQGAIDQTMHQSLSIWRDMCGLYVMGPKCVGCEHALLQKPRPGRPHVIETENWLKAKRQMELDLQRENRTRPEDRPAPEPAPERTSTPEPIEPRIETGNKDLGLTGLRVKQEFQAGSPEEAEAMVELEAKMEAEESEAPQPEETEEAPVEETVEEESQPEEEPEPEGSSDEGIDDDLIAALADD